LALLYAVKLAANPAVKLPRGFIPFSVFGFQFSVSLISKIILLCSEFVALECKLDIKGLIAALGGGLPSAPQEHPPLLFARPGGEGVFLPVSG
jgi:hypothetical protein